MARGFTSLADSQPELCKPLGENTANTDKRVARLRKLGDKPPAYKVTRFGSEIAVTLTTGEQFRGSDLAEIVDKIAAAKINSSNWANILKAENERLEHRLNNPSERERLLHERIEQLENEVKELKKPNDRTESGNDTISA